MEACFLELLELEKKCIRESHITDDGFFIYHHNMPKVNVDAMLFKEDTDSLLFTIPRSGDVLLSIKFKNDNMKISFAKFYQDGINEYIYWSGNINSNEVIANPFYDGIPMLQLGKSMYVRLYGTNLKESLSCSDVQAEFAMLDTESRRELASHNEGVRLTHRDGTKYQVFGLDAWSHSPNVLAPIEWPVLL